MEKFYKESWISLAPLCAPAVIDDRLSKGVVILNQVDPVLERYPELKALFYIVERHGWFGPNEATRADIVLLEDQSVADLVKASSPASVHLDIGPADFVDQDDFFPTGQAARYDVMQVSCWSRRKRIELFIEAAARLPEVSFVHLGHFENNGTAEELRYRDECIALAASLAPNIAFPFGACNSNGELPAGKDEINRWINSARLGVLTTTSEGINRFKMECLSADRPCLVPEDVAWTTRKHINAMTGQLYRPDADSLATAIRASLAQPGRFRPRSYILANTGKRNSLPKLKRALATVCDREDAVFRYGDITWDGRNESLLWGKDAVEQIRELIGRYRHLAAGLESITGACA